MHLDHSFLEGNKEMASQRKKFPLVEQRNIALDSMLEYI